MKDHRTGPHFDEQFWLAVHRRAARVRQLVLGEIEEAERRAFSNAESAQPAGARSDGALVPVFTDGFWEEVEIRARRVRNLAADSLAAAEERLLGEEEVPAPAAPRPSRSRVGSSVRSLGRTFNLQRSDAFGLVAAVIAAILLIPQLIVPVWSNAGVDPPKILRFMVLGDRDGERQASEEEGAEASIDSAQTPDEKSADQPVAGGSSAAGGADAEDGADGTSPSGEGGTSGAAGQGTPGPSQSGAPGVSASASPSPASSPSSPPPVATPPAAPLDVHAVAVLPNAIRISWTDASADEIAFQVDRQVADGAPASIERVERDATGYVWTNLPPETRACFRIRAMGEGAHSEWSPETAPGYVCATTPAAGGDSSGQPAGGPPPVQPQTQTSPAPPPA